MSYLFLGYLLTAYYSNSFVILEDKIIIINRNFPFTRFEKYNFKDLRDIEINKGKSFPMNLISWLFLDLGSNYIKLKLQNTITRKFYCSNLDVDCYDENWTEKNLDDFYNDLKGRNVRVNMKI
ncbi:hypothetical protein ACSIGC_10930 [Tenacibaculum sp. ZS6-P6]|uniref:hypothetical protein n=1 Tax=Tenacibaculum sp. ZS6-P6 TaxID=3447503 RepID=UPI003F9DF131